MSKKILIADDNARLRILVNATLSSEYIVLTASDGVEALDVTRESKPDLILLDIMMPKMDGFEVCRILKSDPDTEFIPIVMLTALGGEEETNKGKQVGANKYISKPFSPRALLDTVSNFLAKHD